MALIECRSTPDSMVLVDHPTVVSEPDETRSDSAPVMRRDSEQVQGDPTSELEDPGRSGFDGVEDGGFSRSRHSGTRDGYGRFE
jgi:hypothetical protein